MSRKEELYNKMKNGRISDMEFDEYFSLHEFGELVWLPYGRIKRSWIKNFLNRINNVLKKKITAFRKENSNGK